MRVHRTLWCTALLQTFWLIAGCCDTEVVGKYEWTAMTLRYLDNSGAKPIEATGDRLPARAYGIRIELEESTIVAARSTVLPVALASPCTEPFVYLNRDSVITLRIHSLGAAAGSTPRDVTDDFAALKAPTGAIESFITIPELIRTMNEKQPVLWKKIDLIRARGDEEPGPLRFIVTMELASRKTFTDTMDLVTLL